MYVCMYVWVFVCMYACVHVCMHVYVGVCMYVCMNQYFYSFTYFSCIANKILFLFLVFLIIPLLF